MHGVRRAPAAGDGARVGRHAVRELSKRARWRR